ASPCLPRARRKWCPQSIGHSERSWTYTLGRSRIGSYFAPGTVGASQGRTWANRALIGRTGYRKIKASPGAEGQCCQRTTCTLGMSECGVLAEYGIVSSG